MGFYDSQTEDANTTPASGGFYDTPFVKKKGGFYDTSDPVQKAVDSVHDVFKGTVGIKAPELPQSPSGEVLSQGYEQPVKHKTKLGQILSSIGSHLFGKEIGGVAQQEKVAGTAITKEQIQKNPEKVSWEEYLRRGLSFGNELAVHPDESITVKDLPEPVTLGQKIAQGIGSTITMVLAQPLIESAATSLITKVPGGEKALKYLSDKSAISPWKVGYPLAVAKAGAEGGLFGLITNNKQTIAENVIDTAGMFAGFTALAFPIQQFFRPILEEVGKSTLTPDRSKAIANEALNAMKTQDVSQTVWFSNPKDPTQLLKVTANGVKVVERGSKEVVESGVKVTEVPELTSIDIEAFKKKPSLYKKLTEWVKGKLKPGEEIPFSSVEKTPETSITPEDVKALAEDIKAGKTPQEMPQQPNTGISPTGSVLATDITKEGLDQIAQNVKQRPSPKVPEQQPISKELEPLAESAKKYETPDEFISAFKSGNLKQNIVNYLISSGEKSDVVFGDLGKVGTKGTMDPLLAEKQANGIIFNIRKNIKDKVNNEVSMNLVNKGDKSSMTKVGEIIKRELTDFYNQATGKVDTLSNKSDNIEYANTTRFEQQQRYGETGPGGGASFRRGNEVGSPNDGNDSVFARSVSENYRPEGKNAKGDVELSKKISSGEVVEIKDSTFDVLKSGGLSDKFIENLKTAFDKGAVKKISISPSAQILFKGKEFNFTNFDAIFYKDGEVLYLNPQKFDKSVFKTGDIINHELNGHAWYLQLSEQDRLAFYKDLKKNVDILKKSWQEVDVDHESYWEDTVINLYNEILKNSSKSVAQSLVQSFNLTGEEISLDNFITRSLNLDKIIESLNTELVRQGFNPITTKAEDTVAVMEHNAVIAENASKLTGDETSIVGRYISDIQTETLTFGQNNKDVGIYQGETDLSTTILEKLKGRDTVSKQFISDLTNSGDIKQVERDLIREVLAGYPDGAKIPVSQFAQDVKIELLPLSTNLVDDIEGSGPKYESITLPDDIRGNVANYFERIYKSPIKTSAGQVHFPGETDSYFGHTRIEDMSALPPGSSSSVSHFSGVRRVIEVQSDLYQKGNLDKETDVKYRGIRIKDIQKQITDLEERIASDGGKYSREFDIKNLNESKQLLKALEQEKLLKEKKIAPLLQYNDPTAHFRMVREEIRAAAKDGKTKLQFPTGETAMKIEGLGDNNPWSVADRTMGLTTDMLKEGKVINQGQSRNDWIITKVLGDGKFEAVPRGQTGSKGPSFAPYPEVDVNGQMIPYNDEAVESFDISGRVNTNNPIYRFYEKDLGRYLKNKYDTKPITDDKGVTWYEVAIKPEMAEQPVLVFRLSGNENIEELKTELKKVQGFLDVAVSNQDQPAFANKIPALKSEANQIRERIMELKFPKVKTGKEALAMAEKRVGLTPEETGLSEAEQQEIDKEYTDTLEKDGKELAEEVKAVRESKLTKDQQQEEINALKLQNELQKEVLKGHPGQKLQRYISRREGEFLDFENPDNAKTSNQRRAIIERNRKVMSAAEAAFQGTAMSDQFDDPDVIRETIEDYRARRADYLEYKNKISQKVKNYNEKKAIIEAVEKQIRAEGRTRMQQIKAVQDYFVLTDKEMRDVLYGNPDLRLISEEKFQDLLKGITGKAYAVAQHREAMLAVEYTILEKELRKVDNLRKALKMKELKNMSIGELEEFDQLLSTYQTGDEFLGPRQIQTAKLTDLGDIKTAREAKEKLAEEAGVPISELQTVQVKDIDMMLYDAALSRQNPLYRVMVDNVNAAHVAATQRFFEVKQKIDELMKAARQSRKRSISQKLIPTDQSIFDYLSADAETKIELAKRMSSEEIKVALYIQDQYAYMRDYLIEQGTLDKYRTNYVTHVRRGILEALKETGKGIFTKEGLKGIVNELFDSYKLQKANFNIVNTKTGEVLALEKFFKYSLQRSDNLIPSKNVAKSFLAYLRTFELKRQLDSFVPKLDIYAHVLTPQETTKRGLLKNDSLQVFMKQWLNTKKGRYIDLGFVKPGNAWDVAVRSGVALTRLIDLGLNIPVGIASNLGAQTSSFIPLGTAKYVRGVRRALTKRGARIAKTYEGLVGESFWDKFSDASKDVGDKTNEILFGLFADADRRAKKVFLLGEMTPEEYASGQLSIERLAYLRNEMGKWHIIDGMSSIMGSTSPGKMFTQYKSWAVPLMHSNLSNMKTVTKMLKAGQNPMKSKEGKELMRSILLMSMILLLGYKTYSSLKSKKNRTFTEQLAFKAMNDSLSIVGALDPSLWASPTRLQKFIGDLSLSLVNIAQSLATGERTATGDIAGATQLGSTIEPKAFQQLLGGKDSAEKTITDSLKTSIVSAQKELDMVDADKVKKVQNIYEQAKKLGFGTKEADALVDEDHMTSDEYDIYKLVKKEGNLEEQISLVHKILPIVQQASDFGFGTKEADALVENLTDNEYELYKKIKTSLAKQPELGVSKWDQQTFLDHVENIAKGWATSPATAFDNLIHGDWKITQLKNGQIIVERMPLDASQEIKQKAAKNNANYKLDHIVPLEVGGTNRRSNLQIITTKEWADNTDVENYLGKQLSEKKITGKEAHEYIIRYKAGKGEILSPDLMKEYKDKYGSSSLTFDEIKAIINP